MKHKVLSIATVVFSCVLLSFSLVFQISAETASNEDASAVAKEVSNIQTSEGTESVAENNGTNVQDTGITSNSTCVLTIEVIGDESAILIKGADVFVKPKGVAELPKVITDKSGVATTEKVPFGQVRIQVIASGWKTFNDVYEVKDKKMSVPVTLKKRKRSEEKKKE